MAVEKWNWWVSDHFFGDWIGPFETKEEAIAEGRAAYGGAQIVVCEALEQYIDLNVFNDYGVAEAIAENNDECASPDGDVLPNVTSDQYKGLADMLNKTAYQWAEKHGINLRAWAFAATRNEETILAQKSHD